MPSSGKIHHFTGLTNSFGSIYLSMKRRNLETSSILVFPFVSPDNASDNRFLLCRDFIRALWFYHLQQKELPLKKSFQNVNSILVPFDAGTQDCRLACVFILSTLALIRVVLALGLRTLLKGCFCQAGWHLVCLYGIDTVFALAS